MDTRNESPWRYFLGVGKEQCKQRGEAGSWWKWNEWEEKLESLGEKTPSPCYMLMGVHVDILEMMGDVESKKKVCQKVMKYEYIHLFFSILLLFLESKRVINSFTNISRIL